MTEEEYKRECGIRKENVEKAMATIVSAANKPDEVFVEALDQYISSMLSLKELEKKTDSLEYANC